VSYPNVADISSAQANPDGSGFDAAAYAASGRQAVIIKSTESVTYHFSAGDQWERDALSHGLAVGRYHWAGSSRIGVLHTPEEEANFFLSFNGEHTQGRFAVCDFENPTGVNRPLYGLTPAQAAAWVNEFMAHLEVHGWPGLGYSMSGSGVVQRLLAPVLKWYAAYPGPVPLDRHLHQFTDNGPVPGVGRCDDSYCYVDLKAFSTPATSGKLWPFQEEPMSYPAPIPADGYAHSVPVPPPHAGGCQGGYGNVWFGGSWDDFHTPLEATLKVRLIGITFDHQLYAVAGTDAFLDLPKTRVAWALKDNTASVSVCIVDDKNEPLVQEGLTWQPMVEAEVKGVIPQ
jgi:GH25 family lysozyme M1 (1,4-beta-N-acetylmuramidase)